MRVSHICPSLLPPFCPVFSHPRRRRSLPHLQVLDLRGHSFRPPTTDFMALARSLQTFASAASPTAPASKPGRLRTLTLKCFKVEGAAGVTALGKALSAERFPNLSALSIDSCRLTNRQLCALAATLPGMTRALTSLSLRSNYALSDEGVRALAEALRTGSTSSSASCSAAASTPAGASHSGCSCSAAGGCSDGGDAAAACSASEESKTDPVLATARSAACSENRPVGAAATKSPPPPQRAPAWSVPSPSPPLPPPPLPPLRPSSCVCRSCTCRRRPTAASAAGTAADAAGDGDGGTKNVAPLRIESLDLSYSCWWSGHSRRPRTGREGRRDGGPFASLLEVLREGRPCLPLRSLRLEGCYLGDTAMGQLVAALENKTGSCRALRELNVNGNLFSEVCVGKTGWLLMVVIVAASVGSRPLVSFCLFFCFLPGLVRTNLMELPPRSPDGAKYLGQSHLHLPVARICFSSCPSRRTTVRSE